MTRGGVVHCSRARVAVGPRRRMSENRFLAMTRRELRRENDELRAALGIRKHRTIEEWERLPATIRDPLAARALIAAWGDRVEALVRLGFPSLSQLPPSQVGVYRDYMERVFGTTGVEAILQRELAGINAERAALLERQVRIALYGADDASVRAFEALARVCGWTHNGTRPTATDGDAPSVARVLASIREGHRAVEAASANIEATADAEVTSALSTFSSTYGTGHQSTQRTQ